GIPDPLWELIAACLDKDPATRPQAAELASALSDHGVLRGPAERGGSRVARAGAKPAAAGPLSPAAADPSTTVARARAGAAQRTPQQQAPEQQAATGAARQFLEPEPTQAPETPAAPGNRSRSGRRRHALAAAAAAVLAGAGAWVAIAMDGSGHA